MSRDVTRNSIVLIVVLVSFVAFWRYQDDDIDVTLEPGSKQTRLDSGSVSKQLGGQETQRKSLPAGIGPRISLKVRDLLTGEPIEGVVFQSAESSGKSSDRNGILEDVQSSLAETDSLVLPRKFFGGRVVAPDAVGRSWDSEKLVLTVPATALVCVTCESLEVGRDEIELVVAPCNFPIADTGEKALSPKLKSVLAKSPSLMMRTLKESTLGADSCRQLRASLNTTYKIYLGHSGLHNLWASSETELAMKVVNVTPGKKLEVILPLSSKPVVEGIVVNHLDEPIANATVKILSSRLIGLDEEIPEIGPGVGRTIKGSRSSDQMFVTLIHSTVTDKNGQFAWTFSMVDNVLVWAFARKPESQFSASGSTLVRNGRDGKCAEPIRVKLTPEVDYGSTMTLSSKGSARPTNLRISMLDNRLSGGGSSNVIDFPVRVEDDRLLIDMLHEGQQYRLHWGRRGLPIKFRPSPGQTILVE